MPFLTNSQSDIAAMLKTIGVGSFEDLIANIPADLRFNDQLQIPEAISEIEITRLIEELGQKNQTGVSFMGGGSLRILYRLYAISARGQPGYAAVYLRISIHGMRINRNGCDECFHVRRRIGAC
jgi:hypothetical protein